MWVLRFTILPSSLCVQDISSVFFFLSRSVLSFAISFKTFSWFTGYVNSQYLSVEPPKWSKYVNFKVTNLFLENIRYLVLDIFFAFGPWRKIPFVSLWSNCSLQIQLRHWLKKNVDLSIPLSIWETARSLMVPIWTSTEGWQRILNFRRVPYADCNVAWDYLYTWKRSPFSSYSMNALFERLQGFIAFICRWISMMPQILSAILNVIQG